MVGVHLGLVVAIDRAAIDEQIAAAMAADVAQRDGLESLSFAGVHGAGRGRMLTVRITALGYFRYANDSLGSGALRPGITLRAKDVIARD
jgi:hypothetical protein